MVSGEWTAAVGCAWEFGSMVIAYFCIVASRDIPQIVAGSGRAYYRLILGSVLV